MSNVNSKKKVPKEKASCTDGSLGIQSYTCRVFTVRCTVHNTHTHIECKLNTHYRCVHNAHEHMSKSPF